MAVMLVMLPHIWQFMVGNTMHQQPIKNFFNLQNNYFHKCVLKTSVTSVPHKYFSQSYQMLGFCYLDKASGGQYNTFFSQNLHQNSFYMQLPANMAPLISHKYQQQQSGAKAVCMIHISRQFYDFIVGCTHDSCLQHPQGASA